MVHCILTLMVKQFLIISVGTSWWIIYGLINQCKHPFFQYSVRNLNFIPVVLDIPLRIPQVTVCLTYIIQVTSLRFFITVDDEDQMGEDFVRILMTESENVY